MSALPPMPHLIVALATSPSQGCQQAMKNLALPQLDRLLARLSPAGLDAGNETDFSPPHERALARHLGLAAGPAGTTPWAAWHRLQTPAHMPTDHGLAWAFITPCQWQADANHVLLADPAQLQLTEDDSRSLLAILAPWFAEDGIQLEFTQPGQWLARGEVFRDLRCASLDRAINRHVDRWTQPLDAAPQLRRLQTEVQMLLYDHAFNHARTEQGLLPVNAFWVSGAGVCDAGDGQDAVGSPPILVNLLRDGALAGDAQAWREAWARVDHDHIAPALQGGQGLRLTLCGEQHAVSLETATPGLLQRLLLPFQRKNGSERAWDLLCSL